MAESDQAHPFDGLAAVLELIASPVRLQLLHGLREPKRLNEIRVQAARSVADERPGRAISRQSVKKHLDRLMDGGLVRRLPDGDGESGDRYVLSHDRLFALLDEVRQLVRLRPVVEALAVEETMEGSSDEPGRAPPSEGPRLRVTYGRDDGMGHPLLGPPGSLWRIGRAPSCDIVLDYDPFASAVNSVVERTATGFVVQDEGARNGTAVNGVRLVAGGSRALTPGDVVRVGRTTFVFQV